MTSLQSIEFMTGMILCVIGLSYLKGMKGWMSWIENLAIKPGQSSLVIGAINLVAGVFIIAFHWVWQGTQTIVTILGLLMTLKGVVHLLYPFWLTAKLNIILPHSKNILAISGLVTIVVGAFILHDLFLQPGVRDYWLKPFLL